MTSEAWVNTVRLARDLGTVRELLPDGIKEVSDLPHTLFTALQHGLTYLSFEELPKDEIPPRRMWDDPEALNEWFQAVEKRREQKYGKEAIEDPVENDAASSLIVGTE